MSLQAIAKAQFTKKPKPADTKIHNIVVVQSGLGPLQLYTTNPSYLKASYSCVVLTTLQR